jgi:hypothetical protein
MMSRVWRQGVQEIAGRAFCDGAVRRGAGGDGDEGEVERGTTWDVPECGRVRCGAWEERGVGEGGRMGLSVGAGVGVEGG